MTDPSLRDLLHKLQGRPTDDECKEIAMELWCMCYGAYADVENFDKLSERDKQRVYAYIYVGSGPEC